MSAADGSAPGRARTIAGSVVLAATLLIAAATTLPVASHAEQASQPGAPAAGFLDASAGATDASGFTCARRRIGDLRCWGYGGDGRLGYASVESVGDDETPGSVAAPALGLGRAVAAVAAGAFHACALLDDGTVRCWGFGSDGRLGYGNTRSVGDDESPESAGPVDLGRGRTATAISAGGAHTCALLDDGGVRCWGFGDDGRLGLGNRDSVGDDEAPGSVAPVSLGQKATAISTGANDSCAILQDGSVRCWGLGSNGQLGYGNSTTIGQSATAPADAGPVSLGAGRTAKAISAGSGHTCALLDDGSVRCWGFGGNGRLGYGNTRSIGDNELPSSVDPVNLGRPATAVSAGDSHSCAILDDGTVRCWGFARDGRLGSGNANDIGDDEVPAAVAPVDLGVGRRAVAISAGGRHTCTLLDDATIRCWGSAAHGRLGYCNAADIGDDETPGSAGPVNLDGPSADCVPASAETPSAAASPPPPPRPSPAPVIAISDTPADAQARRAAAFWSCVGRAGRSAKARRRAARRACYVRYARTPGRVRGLVARARGRTVVTLRFRASGTDGVRPPAATRYTIVQTQMPQRRGSAREPRRTALLCHGACRFAVGRVGAQITLTVTNLRPATTYRYAVTALDNVSGRHSRGRARVSVRTRP